MLGDSDTIELEQFVDRLVALHTKICVHCNKTFNRAESKKKHGVVPERNNACSSVCYARHIISESNWDY